MAGHMIPEMQTSKHIASAFWANILHGRVGGSLMPFQMMFVVKCLSAAINAAFERRLCCDAMLRQ